MKVFFPLKTGGLVIVHTPADVGTDPASSLHGRNPEEQAASRLLSFLPWSFFCHDCSSSALPHFYLRMVTLR